MKTKMVIYRDAKRYWATKDRSKTNGKPMLLFWSSHKFPFHHASYQPDWLRNGEPVTPQRRKDAWRAFRAFVPYHGWDR
jgi:hypothetical protein